MRLLLLLGALTVLAACGVDGAPEKPEPKTGVSVTGTVSVGVRGTI